MKRFITVILSLIITLSLCCGAYVSGAAAYEDPYIHMGYTYDDMDILIELIEEQISRQKAAHKMADAARALGYAEDHEVILLAQQEWTEAQQLQQSYQKIYDKLESKWHQKEEEYPVATYIWSYFKELGYNDQVCAGILGNLMAEVGGQTLDIQYWLSGNGYYGMCQWNKAYSAEVWGASLEEQCAFLQNTIKYEIDTFGYAYKKSFNYDSFLALTDCEKAALAFAKCYERCGSSSYYTRQSNAIRAYNYFIS